MLHIYSITPKRKKVAEQSVVIYTVTFYPKQVDEFAKFEFSAVTSFSKLDFIWIMDLHQFANYL